jgi:hexosaminidase
MEIDGPGHAWSWGRGYPEILSDCAKKYFYNPNDFALNPTIDKTYEVLEGIMKDVVNAANSKYFHLGGDEVVYGCWAQDDSIRAYMKENGFEGDYKKLLAMYTERADALAISMGQTPVHWEDTFIAGVRPDKKVIFDVWTNSSQIKSVTQEGYRVIAAPSDYWYLNYCSPLQCWNTIYTYEPTSDLSPEEAALVIGGEASMWDEQTDSTNIVQKIWPNAAAAGERLWSPQMTNSTIIVDVDDGPAEAILADAQIRLETFRCRMNARGFAAGPLSPGFCPQMLV